MPLYTVNLAFTIEETLQDVKSKSLGTPSLKICAPIGEDSIYYIYVPYDYFKVPQNRSLAWSVYQKLNLALKSTQPKTLERFNRFSACAREIRRTEQDKRRWALMLILWIWLYMPQDYTEGGKDVIVTFAEYFELPTDIKGIKGTLFDIMFDIDNSKTILIQNPQALQRIAFEKQLNEDQVKLFAEIIAPTIAEIILTVVSFLPPARLAKVGIYVFEAVVGLLQFLVTIYRIKQDEQITADEIEDAWWASLGIIPFRQFQMLLMGAAIFSVAMSLIQAFIEAIQQLIAQWEERQAAYDAGWGEYIEYNPEGAFFISDSDVEAFGK